MPVHYRNFYVRKLTKDNEKERLAYEAKMGQQEVSPTKVVKGPSIQKG